MSKNKLSSGEISTLALSLAMLLRAGVDVGTGLSLLAEEEPASPYKDLLLSLGEKVDDGQTLASAVKESGSFPGYVTSLLEVGQSSGRTENALRAIARYYEDRQRLERTIRSSLLYPAVLLVVMLAVIVVLLVEVLPVFNDVYAYLGGQLTGVAGGLLTLGNAIDRAMPFLCALLGVIIVIAALVAAVPAFREKVSALWRKICGDKGLSRRLNTARFAQALSMALSSSLPLDRALQMAASQMEDIPGAKARCERCMELVDSGQSLSAAMRESGVLPPAECRLLEIGARGGSADEAMEQISRRLTEESEQALEEAVGKVEPALVMVTSVLVGAILLSVMLPLMNIMTAIG